MSTANTEKPSSKIHETHFHDTVFGPVHTGSGNININVLSLVVAKGWVSQQLRWSEATDHARSSWAGMVIWSLSALMDRLTPLGLLHLLVSLLLWVMTAWLMTPFLNWPLEDAAARFAAALQYAIGSLLIPLFVALLTQADEQTKLCLETRRDNFNLLFLKLSGAYVGFHALLGLLWLPVLALYYLEIAVPVWWWQVLVVVPLLFSHITARRIPADRYKMYGVRPQLHPADKLFLPTFVLFGPFLAGFIYLWYDFFANRIVGVVFLFVFIGVALWEQKKRFPSFLSDLRVMLLLGFLLPLVALALPLLFMTEPPSGWEQYLLIILVVEHFIGAALLWVTLWLRNKPILTLKGVIGLLLLLFGLNGVLTIHLTVGRWLTLLLLAFWALWGRKYFRPYLWIHTSFVTMILVMSGSLVLATQNIIPIGVHIIGLGVMIILLVLWAYWPVPLTPLLEIAKDLPSFTLEEQSKFIVNLSGIIKTNPDDVCILDITSGSVLIKLEMPDEAAAVLLSMILKGNPMLDALEITKIELIREPTKRISTNVQTDDHRINLLPKIEQVNMAKLREFTANYFNETELRDLCFDLQVDYESLPGQGKRDKARELVAFMERRERIDEFLLLCYQRRSNIKVIDLIT